MSIAMIQREKIEELLKLPAEERRRVLRLLQESLSEEGEAVAPAQMEIKLHRLPSGCCPWRVVTQEDRVTPLPTPMRSSAPRSISTVD